MMHDTPQVPRNYSRGDSAQSSKNQSELVKVADALNRKSESHMDLEQDPNVKRAAAILTIPKRQEVRKDSNYHSEY